MEEKIIMILVPMIVTAVVNLLVLGINKKQEDKIKQQINEEVGTKLDSFIKDFNDFKKNSYENDLAILWGLLNDKATEVIKKKKCDENTFYYFDNLFLRYKSLGGNHGMELTHKKIKNIYERELAKQENIEEGE